jgi:hypothetical protein
MSEQVKLLICEAAIATAGMLPVVLLALRTVSVIELRCGRRRGRCLAGALRVPAGLRLRSLLDSSSLRDCTSTCPMRDVQDRFEKLNQRWRSMQKGSAALPHRV